MFLKPLSVTAIILLTFSAACHAQDTLPHISVKYISNKVIVSWHNTYGARISNINIQRSADSLKNFTTIGSVLEPNNKENGFVDSKNASLNLYYRVFVAFEGGRYVFSKSSKPVEDTSTTVPVFTEPPVTEPEKPVITPAPPQPAGFVPSKYIFTGKDNSVIIDLPGAPAIKYAIEFFDENNNRVFAISKVTDPYLTIEKVNFLHAGWFYFKLYENGALKEKNQFYIPKEGRFGIPPDELKKKF